MKEYFKAKSGKTLYCKKLSLKKTYCFIISCLAYIAWVNPRLALTPCSLVTRHSFSYSSDKKEYKTSTKKGPLGSPVAITFSVEANTFCICAYQLEILVSLPERPLLSLGRRQITVSPVPITSH